VFVCVCVLLSVSLVQCRIPSYCRKYISDLQTYAHEPDSTDDDDNDENDDEVDDVESDDEDSMREAIDEISMLNLMINFMK